MRKNSFLYQGLSIFFILWFIFIGILVQMEYGTDVDSWYLAGNSFKIYEQDTYFASRSPGFPLYEIILSTLIPSGGYLLSNLFSTLFAVILAGCFLLQLKKEAIGLPVLATASLVAFPLFIVAASSTIDYLPALCLLWISYYLLYAYCEKGKNDQTLLYLSAGILGLSAGFRLTSLGFILPSVIFLFKEQKALKEISIYCIIVAIGCTLAFLPVMSGPGLSLPLGQSILSLSYHLQVFFYNALMFWGIIPLIVLLIGLLIGILDLKKQKFKQEKSFASSDAFHLSVIIVYTGFLFLLPDESSYLLPLLPSTLLLVSRYFRAYISWVFFLAILLTNFTTLEIKGGESGKRKFHPHFVKGLYIKNYQERNWRINLREAVNQVNPSRPTLLMMEMPWIHSLDNTWRFDKKQGHYRKDGSLFFFGPYIFDHKELLAKKEAGYKICVWRNQKWEYYALGLEKYLGKEIEVVELSDILPLSP